MFTYKHASLDAIIVHMNIVYWLAQGESGVHPKMKEFLPKELTQTLNYAEMLRKARRDGSTVDGELVLGYVSICCENPDSVGLPGVSDPPKDYDWSKQHRGAGPAKV